MDIRRLAEKWSKLRLYHLLRTRDLYRLCDGREATLEIMSIIGSHFFSPVEKCLMEYSHASTAGALHHETRGKTWANGDLGVVSHTGFYVNRNVAKSNTSTLNRTVGRRLEPIRCRLGLVNFIPLALQL